ncbi:MAG: hypothetical protein AB1758_35345, partial [Candidatus Eremiobacterota bacterium]
MILLLLVSLLLGVRPHSTAVYVTSFQRGELLVLDLESGRRLHTLKVDDGAGMVGFETSPDGKLLYLVDGSLGAESRLRVLEAATMKAVREERFDDRSHMLGGPPVTCLAGGRWLLIQTYDYSALAAGVRVYDTLEGRFLRGGLGCGPPDMTTFLSVGDTTFGWSTTEAFLLELPGRVSGFSVRARVAWPFRPVTQAAALEDALYAVEFFGGPEWRLAIWER